MFQFLASPCLRIRKPPRGGRAPGVGGHGLRAGAAGEASALTIHVAASLHRATFLDLATRVARVRATGAGVGRTPARLHEAIRAVAAIASAHARRKLLRGVRQPAPAAIEIAVLAAERRRRLRAESGHLPLGGHNLHDDLKGHGRQAGGMALLRRRVRETLPSQKPGARVLTSAPSFPPAVAPCSRRSS